MRNLSSLFGTPPVHQEPVPDEMLRKLTRPPPAFMFQQGLDNDEDYEMDVIRLDNYVDDDLPSPEELKTHGLVPPTPLVRKRWFKWACFGLVCFTLFVIMVATLASSNRSSSKGTTGSNEQENDFETIALPASHTSRLKATISFLLDDVEHQTLTNTTSPQFMAAEWMAEVDPRSAALNSEFLERYALVVLWFATRGENWNHPVNFLSLDHHCDWRSTFQRDDLSVFEMGVECNEKSEVKSIVLRKYHQSFSGLFTENRISHTCLLQKPLVSRAAFLLNSKCCPISKNSPWIKTN